METDQWRGDTLRWSNCRRPARTASVSAFPPLVTPDGEALDHYDFVTGLILTPGNKELPQKVSTRWQGNIPTFRKLRWDGGEFAPRPKPYLGDRNAEI